MKWNWGTKLVLWMGAFMTLIIVFTALMMNEDISLVEKDYYPKGQAHQELIDKKHKAENLADQIRLRKNNGRIELQFPVDILKEAISGELQLYHVEDDKQDQYFAVDLDDSGMMAIDVLGLSGRYTLKIDWETASDKYYTELKGSLP
ncbi:MAG: FixH family protein [Bacteroidales bacterium]|nr:FixH family protein [Bacteroidales bacterium]